MKRAVCPLALALLLAGFAAAQQPAVGTQDEPPPPEPTMRVDVDLVNIFFTVKTKKGGELISNLEQKNFQIAEDGKQQTIQHFSRETDLPLTLGLLIDISASQERLIDIEREAAAGFFSSVI